MQPSNKPVLIQSCSNCASGDRPKWKADARECCLCRSLNGSTVQGCGVASTSPATDHRRGSGGSLWLPGRHIRHSHQAVHFSFFFSLQTKSFFLHLQLQAFVHYFVMSDTVDGMPALPLVTYASFSDVQREMSKNKALAELVQKSVDHMVSINVGETMKQLMTATSTIQLAVAASHGSKCNAIITKMLSRYQTLVKDCRVTIGAFLSTSVEAVDLHQSALELLEDEDGIPDAIEILSRIVQMADAMAEKAGGLVVKSSELVQLGEDGLVSATEDRSTSIEERKKVEKNLSDTKAEKAALETKKRELRKRIKEATRAEEAAVEEAAIEREREFALKMVGSVLGAFTEIASAYTGKRAIATLTAQSVARAVNKEDSDSPESHAPAAQSSPQSREVLLTQARLDLQKLELEACEAMAKAVSKLETGVKESDDLQRAVESLDVAVQALGRVKTTFENTRVFWESVSAEVAKLGRAATTTTRFKKLSILRKRITANGFDWMALGQVNYTAMAAIKQADGSVDAAMNNLPTMETARKLVQELLPPLKQQIQEEQDRLALSIQAGQ